MLTSQTIILIPLWPTPNIFAPEKTVRITKKNFIRQPWMTPALLNSTKTKDRMYRNCLGQPPTSIAYKNFVTYRTHYKNIKQRSKQDYYHNLLSEYRTDLRKTWHIFNSIIGRTADKTGISDMFHVNNVAIKNLKTIADKFCDFFSEIGQNFASQIPDPRNSFLTHLTKNNPNQHSFFMNPTSPDEIHKIIASLKSKNSSGHDKISPKMLKALNDVVSAHQYYNKQIY